MILIIGAVAAVLTAGTDSYGQGVDLSVWFDRAGRLEFVTGEVVEIRWEGVEDSRCPEGAVCVCEGQVSVSLGVTVNGEDLGIVGITLHVGDEDLARAEVGGVRIHLTGVTPYPVLDVEIPRNEYAAQLMVIVPGATAVIQRSWEEIKKADINAKVFEDPIHATAVT